MDLKKIFRGISAKLLADFEISSQVNHQGVKGTYRESALKDFLLSGRLPAKYGLGSGEIVSPTMDVSKQCDLIIYDQFNNIPLLYDEQIQVYPIDSIYGVIEVKSGLSKPVLFEALENIRAVKRLAPGDIMEIQSGPYVTQTMKRPIPFGVIFAYSLAGNSLDSLKDNLREWERDTDSNYWPNMIVVLGEGTIYHKDGLNSCFSNDEITKQSIPIAFYYKRDALFNFYCTLLDLCRSMYLAPINLNSYFEPAIKMGSYIVKNHDRLSKRNPDGSIKDRKAYRLNLNCIHRIVTYCKDKGKIKYRDILLKQIGMIPVGMTNQDYECYFYDPENLPGLHEIEDPFHKNEFGHLSINVPCQIPPHYIEVDGEIYHFSSYYIQDEDIEEDPLHNYEDL